MTARLSETLQVRQGPVDLTSFDSRDTPGFSGHKKKQPAAMADLSPRLSGLQEKLFAGAAAGDSPRRLLVVLQGMDTSGKGGTIRHAVGLLDPQGVRIASFKKPTATELRHDFLWRIAKQLPHGGEVGIFDRSHYEDVLIGRVRSLAPAAEIERRYGAINDFEAALVADGCVVLKCFLHIGADDQYERLQARLDDPSKHWKYNPGDVDERELWPQYREAYEIALERCSTVAAPWYLVPSGRKWYRNWAVATLIAEHLEAMGLGWPEITYDPTVEKARLAETASIG